MKNVLVAGMLAICVIAVSQQQASAWVNQKFGFGINWEMQSGGNSICKGLWHNGQPPSPETMQGSSYGNYPQYGAPQFSQAQVEMPAYQSTYAPPSVNYGMPSYQFATYPRQTYYYPAPSYYYGR